MQKPVHDDPKAMCPLWRKPCIKVCHACEWWDFLRIADPLRPGQQIDKWMCAMRKVADLGLANLQAQRETGAQVQEFRNETRRENAGAIAGVLGHLNQSLQEMKSLPYPAAETKLIEN